MTDNPYPVRTEQWYAWWAGYNDPPGPMSSDTYHPSTPTQHAYLAGWRAQEADDLAT